MDIEITERLVLLEEIKTLLIENDELDEEILLDIETHKYYLEKRSTEKYSVIKKQVKMSKEFKNEIKNTEKIELTVIQDEKCPLTQEKIKDPFVSQCGHIMERSAIKEYLKNNRNCPVVGCVGQVKEKKN
ncbi:hypothetical protein SLOPH_1786 [Spraguea lophii 42_110]|uniref:U-box domain-containing protein n=1 Tax=Spraguea lophii (strain 42_110) TaxID=1358809 RepID=S7W8V4_SPRLO|nr:hypothetical protein SLOPH_1786 [Spraguea lophii 42_110]